MDQLLKLNASLSHSERDRGREGGGRAADVMLLRKKKRGEEAEPAQMGGGGGGGGRMLNPQLDEGKKGSGVQFKK